MFLLQELPADLGLANGDLLAIDDENRFEYLLGRALAARALAADGEHAEEQALLLRVLRANRSAVHRYAPRPYPGALTLFRAKRLAGQDAAGDPAMTKELAEYSLGWSALGTGGVHIVEASGTHADMLRAPHVQRLARQINACISVMSRQISPRLGTPADANESERNVHHEPRLGQ
jgi:thioesterase domain-containing protein